MKDYNGADRQLLKLFLKYTQTALRKVFNLGPDVFIGFFLQIFEQEIGERIPKDKYDLKALAVLLGKQL